MLCTAACRSGGPNLLLHVVLRAVLRLLPGFRFNKEFEDLVKQKHTDADCLTDLNTRVDELIRELVKIHLVLNPAAAAAGADGAAAGADPVAAPAVAGGCSSMAGAAAGGVVSGASTAREGAPGTAEGRGDVASVAQLAVDLGAGRLVPYWSTEESLEEMLLKIQPGEVKVGGCAMLQGGRMPARLDGSLLDCVCTSVGRDLVLVKVGCDKRKGHFAAVATMERQWPLGGREHVYCCKFLHTLLMRHLCAGVQVPDLGRACQG